MRFLIGFFVVLFLCSFERGEEYGKTRFSVFAGARLFTLQDLGQSSLLYQGFGGFYGLNYLPGKKGLSTFDLNFSYAILNTPDISQTATTNAQHYTLNMSYNYLPVEAELAQGLIISYGGKIPVNLNATKFHKFGNNNFGYDYNVTINPMVKGHYKRKKIDLSLSFDFPLIGYTVRPLHKNIFPAQHGSVTPSSVLKNGQFRTINKLFYLHVLLNVRPHFTGFWKRFSFFYDMDTGANSSVEKRAYLYQTLGVNISLAFKRKKTK